MVEYVGEAIDLATANQRLANGIALIKDINQMSTSETTPKTYLLMFTPGLIIDAQKVGNVSRFVNHSCEPNLVAKCYNVNGQLRMGRFKSDLKW